MIDDLINKSSAHKEIKLLLGYSYRLYKEYLKSNKKFIYASILRKVNDRLYERLQKSMIYLKDNSHADAFEFMLHLDVWMTIWDYEYEKQKPTIWDVFIFNNDIRFPNDSVKILLADLAELEE